MLRLLGGDGHCLQYSVQDQLAQQGFDGQTMQVLRPAMATFIGEKAEYFKHFLTAEECERTAWNELLSDIRHSVGNAKRWGGDLEISALSCMFQCTIQYITSRQGHEFEEFVTMNPNASLLELFYSVTENRIHKHCIVGQLVVPLWYQCAVLFQCVTEI